MMGSASLAAGTLPSCGRTENLTTILAWQLGSITLYATQIDRKIDELSRVRRGFVSRSHEHHISFFSYDRKGFDIKIQSQIVYYFCVVKRFVLAKSADQGSPDWLIGRSPRFGPFRGPRTPTQLPAIRLLLPPGRVRRCPTSDPRQCRLPLS